MLEPPAEAFYESMAQVQVAFVEQVKVVGRLLSNDKLQVREACDEQEGFLLYTCPEVIIQAVWRAQPLHLLADVTVLQPSPQSQSHNRNATVVGIKPRSRVSFNIFMFPR